MSTNYATNYNEFEVNYRFAGHNQPDQLVLNPNGRWYRECQTGYYYSYFFGMQSDGHRRRLRFPQFRQPVRGRQ